MKQIINYNCDGQGNGNCSGEDSEVRVLPLGGSANAILCKAHFIKERNWRRTENNEKFPTNVYWEDEETLKKVPHPNAYDLPSWYSLKIYNGAD